MLGCSPVVRIEARFELPPEAGPLDPTRLHVRGRVVCRSFSSSDPEPKSPAPPPVGLEEADPDSYLRVADDAGAARAYRPRLPNEERPVVFQREGATFRASFRSTQCWVALSAFYDTNGDGVLNDGDYVAAVPAVLVVDHGLCQGNLNSLGPVTLKPLR
jgi:hypothetical protein